MIAVGFAELKDRRREKRAPPPPSPPRLRRLRRRRHARSRATLSKRVEEEEGKRESFSNLPLASDDRRHLLPLFTDRLLFNVEPVVCVRARNRAIKYVARGMPT